jgi:hypothetical protein
LRFEWACGRYGDGYFIAYLAASGLADGRCCAWAGAQVEESDPSNRWLRYKERLGQGSFKVCYKGFDKKLGIEIAWNKVTPSRRAHSLWMATMVPGGTTSSAYRRGTWGWTSRPQCQTTSRSCATQLRPVSRVFSMRTVATTKSSRQRAPWM